jgi:hypothetical protein
VSDFYPPEISIGLPPGVELPPVVPKLKKPSKRDTMSDEFDIRAAVVGLLLASGIKREEIRIEIPLDTASSAGRADIVLLRPKELVCIELKSGKDKYDQADLREQTRHYRRVFDVVSVVIDKVHFREREENGIGRHNWDRVNAAYCHETKAFIDDYQYKSKRVIEHHAHILDYPAPSSVTSPNDMLHILWADECKTLTGYRQKSLFIRHARENLCLREVRDIVLKALSRRPLNKWEEKFWDRFDKKESGAES